MYGLVYPKAVPSPMDDMPQAEAKRFLPPDAHVWRSNVRGGWHFQVGNHPRGSENWAGSSYRALMEVMRRAWVLWLSGERLPLSACPIPGLFKDGDA